MTYRYSNAQIIAMAPAAVVSQGANPVAMPVAGQTPRAHVLGQRIVLQTPMALPIPGMDTPPLGAQPTLWPLPADMRIIARTHPDWAYDLLTTAQGASNRDSVTVRNATWGCRVSITVKQINDALTLFALQGVDADERSTLLALRRWLSTPGANGTRAMMLARPAPNADNAAGLIVLNGEPQHTWLIQTNLSKQSVPSSQEQPAASLEQLERFIALLWEGSVVGGVGYTLGLEAGLHASALNAEGVAVIDLLVIAGTQKDPAPEGRTLLPFNNCALIAPGLDATIDTLFAEDHNEDDMIPQALLPAGCAGFSLTFQAPPDEAIHDPSLRARHLFSLVGADILPSDDSPYSLPASGMPTPPTPTENDSQPAWKRQRLIRRGLLPDPREALDADPYWLYEQVLPLYRFATTTTLPDVAGLPAPETDPYRGFGWAQNLPNARVDLSFHDILGNQSQSSAGQGQVNLPVGYSDPLLGVSDWPALAYSYTVAANDDQAHLVITLEPRPSTAMPSPSQAGNAAVLTSMRQAEAYTKAYYQLGQQLTVQVFSTLTDLQIVDPQLLWRFAAAAQAFNASAGYFSAAHAPEGATLGSLKQDFGLRNTEMVLANIDTPMHALFGETAVLKVPAYAVVAESDNAETIAGANRPTGWPSISAKDLLSAPQNGALPLRAGAVLAVSPPRVINTTDGRASLASLANALGTLAELLASDNASETILTPMFVFSMEVSAGQQVSVTVTAADAPQPVRSLAQVCSAFAAQGVNVTPAQLGQQHQTLPGIFQASQTISSNVWVAGQTDTLAQNSSGLGQAELAALNTGTVNLFDMGTLLYLGDFHQEGGITADGAQTLGVFADAYACPPELLLDANPDLPLPADTAFNLPGRVAWPTSEEAVRIPYTVRSGDTLNGIAPRFDWGNPKPALALADANLNMPKLVAGGVTLSITVAGQPYSITTDDAGQSLAQTVAQVHDLVPAVTLLDVLNSIGDDSKVLTCGALLICPAALLASATSPAEIASLLGVSAGAFAQANAGVPNLLNVGVTLAAPHSDVHIATRANDCLNSLVVRFADLGVQTSVKDLVEAPSNTHALLFAAQARALVPPATASISVPISTQSENPGPAFPLLVILQLIRPEALLHPEFTQFGAGVMTAHSLIPAPHMSDSEGGDLAFNRFVAALREHIPHLRIASGPVQDTNTDLWAVDFGPNGISSLQIAGTTTVPGAPGPQPRFFALTPLYKNLVSRHALTLHTLLPDGTLAPSASARHFQGVDVWPWAERFLLDLDRMLNALNAAALYRSPDCRQTLSDLLAVKRRLAAAIPLGLAPLLDIDDADAIAGQAQAATTLEQHLDVSLSQAWSASTLVQLNRTITSPWPPQLRPANLYGAVNVIGVSEDRSWSMTTGKCWLNDFSPFITLPLTLVAPANQRAVTADLAFGITHMEINIGIDGMPDGYPASDWLTFIPPLTGDNLPSSLSTDLGKVSMPVPLRTFPVLPKVIEQRASASALSAQQREIQQRQRLHPLSQHDSSVTLKSMPLWDYRFTYTHEHAEQDEVSLNLRFNVHLNEDALRAATDEDLFVQLARYIEVADDLWKILDTLSSEDLMNVTQCNAAKTFHTLASAVGEYWTVRSEEPAARRWSAAEGDQFTFRARATTRPTGQDGNREFSGLFLNADSQEVAPRGFWPEVSVLTQDGQSVELSRSNTIPGESYYAVPGDVHVPASGPILSLTFVLLNLARWQNAIGSVLVRRNQKLLGDKGPDTNPAFVFQTDEVQAPSAVTPFNNWDERVSLSSTPTTLSAALQAAFDTLFRDPPKNGGLHVTLGVAYVYELATEPSDSHHALVGETPVCLYTSPSLDASTAGHLQSAIDDWRKQNAPRKDGGEWAFSLTLYSSQEEHPRPLMSIANLYLPLALEQG
ncbi:LysM peptidoglycan-binding domain-containing protein [Pseudomonas sp. NPDC090233]|uniref:LysM peptidoglycan-binding domain-containing protein n=1 Tax=Pseudomonas sp. NPDC090233 TaxID=3364479 RepID=UPI00383ACF3F